MSECLQSIVDATQAGDTVTLADGVYDDDVPVQIRKDIRIVGSRNAIVNSEAQISGGCTCYIIGVTVQKNKEGAATGTGSFMPYAQQGHFFVRDAHLAMDDCEFTTTAGWGPKAAIAMDHGRLELRTMDVFSRIDWRLNKGSPLRLNYNSYANVFGGLNHPDDLVNYCFNILSGAENTTDSTRAQGIQLCGSKMTMSGANLFNYGTALYGVYASRHSYVQIGAGFVANVFNLAQSANGWSAPVLLDATGASKWVAPGCNG